MAKTKKQPGARAPEGVQRKTMFGTQVEYALVRMGSGKFAPALVLPKGQHVWIGPGGGERRKPDAVAAATARARVRAHEAAGLWRTAANPWTPPEDSLIRPGMQVRELDRPEGGGQVMKLRPQGMVVVLERDGQPRQRRLADLVPVGPARRNPKRVAATPEEERAAVVAWLRAQRGVGGSSFVSEVAAQLATKIARGAHIRGRK